MSILQCINQIVNMDPVYSTGNTAQYFVITYVGKNGKKNEKKEWIYIFYVYKKLNHLAIHLKRTQHCKSTMESENSSHSVLSDSLLPMYCSLPVSRVHGILKATILEWVAIPFSRGSS